MSGDQMLAARLNLDTRKLSLQNVPVPVPGPGEVRIKVRAAGVCLTDVHLIGGVVSPPMKQSGEVTLGHEVSGVVDQLGPGVDGWRDGDRVMLFLIDKRRSGVWTLGLDFDGGRAEYVVVPETLLVPIPDALSFEQAAIIPDAMSTPWDAVTRTARVQAGEAVAIWGVGGLGAHAIQLLRFVGAAPIIAIDPAPVARSRALALGAGHVVDPSSDDATEAIRSATGGRGVDASFDFAGHPSVPPGALGALAPEGRLILVGVSGQPFEVTDSVTMTVFNQQIRGHFANGIDALSTLPRLIELGRMDFSTSIAAVLPLSEAADAVHRLEHKIGDPIRIVLQP